MNSHKVLLTSGFMLASMLPAFGQPSVLSLKLSGQPQTAYDSLHPYASFSASPVANVALTVTASGTAPLGYQWRFNQNFLPGQTNLTLPLSSLQLRNAGDYSVVVTNSSGSVTSRVAILTVDPAFTKITTGPVVTDAGFSQGGAWGDYNNNGFLDLLVVSGQDGNASLPFLYR